VGPHIEIHDVNAHVVDGYGRVHAVRVIGFAERRDQKVLVTLSPGNADGKAPLEWSLDFRASESARWVRPGSVGWHSKAEFRRDVRAGVCDPRPAHFWCSELDLTMHPKFPPIQLGLQPVPLWVEAKYLQIGDDYAVTEAVPALPLVKAFPVGVLFVHGIGTQTKSETLIDWTAPLLRSRNLSSPKARSSSSASERPVWAGNLCTGRRSSFFHGAVTALHPDTSVRQSLGDSA
jgi:hypothetical protein